MTTQEILPELLKRLQRQADNVHLDGEYGDGFEAGLRSVIDLVENLIDDSEEPQYWEIIYKRSESDSCWIEVDVKFISLRQTLYYIDADRLIDTCDYLRIITAGGVYAEWFQGKDVSST